MIRSAELTLEKINTHIKETGNLGNPNRMKIVSGKIKVEDIKR